jgi:hypothetical protein
MPRVEGIGMAASENRIRLLESSSTSGS